MLHHCGMCGRSFKSRGGLASHIATHEDNRVRKLSCPVCYWDFDDSLALEQHQSQNGHYIHPFACETCTKTFTSMPALEEHHRKAPRCRKGVEPSSKAQQTHEKPTDTPAKVITCDRCSNTFTSQRQYKAHRSFPNGSCADFRKQTTRPQSTKPTYIDIDQPRDTGNGIFSYSSSSDTPADMSDSGYWCRVCKTVFESQAKFNNHALACSARKRGKFGATKSSLVVGKSVESIQPAVSQATRSVIKSSRATASQVITGNNTKQTASLPLRTTASRTSIESIQPTLSQPIKPVVRSSRETPLRAVTNNAQQSKPVKQPATASGKSTEATQPILSRGPKSGADASRTPPVQALPTAATNSNAFPCTVQGCGKSFKSEAGLKTHKSDAHGIGGRALDLTSRQSSRLSAEALHQQKAEAILAGRSGSADHRRRRAPRGVPAPRLTFTDRSLSTSMPHSNSAPNPMNANRTYVAPSAPVGVAEASHGGPNGVLVGSAEMEQGKHIQGKILRLMIQEDIFVRQDGVVTACGLDWNRLSVSTQQAFVDLFDNLCHLPKALQGEYLPPPKAFRDDYVANYPVADFEASPDRDPAKPGLSVVAIACSKVVLVDSCQEVVKVAAIDVTSCRILMSHLVCTNPHAQVENWNSAATGLFAWGNMEQDRQAGYKVFKGWPAVRSALWRFVDKETILLGHNLRADLDALRMVHGRAVDIAKVVEKAAKGPLSKQQLNLDSLCRDYPKISLKSDPECGRDCLMNAFAIRQLGCWILKNQEKLSKDAKQKSVDYQKVEKLLKAQRG